MNGVGGVRVWGAVWILVCTAALGCGRELAINTDVYRAQRLWIDLNAKPDPTSRTLNQFLGSSLPRKEDDDYPQCDISIPTPHAYLSELKMRLETAARSPLSAQHALFFNRLILSVGGLTSTNEISYGDLLNVAYYSSIAFTVAMPDPPRDLPFPDPMLSRKGWYEKLKVLAEAAPYFMLMPSFDKWTATDFNELRPYPIYPLGQTTQYVFADRKYMSPWRFFIHDVLHSLVMINADLKDERLLRIDLTGQQRIAQRLEFHHRFRELGAKSTTAEVDAALDDLWFAMWHERFHLPYGQRGLARSMQFTFPYIYRELGQAQPERSLTLLNASMRLHKLLRELGSE